MTLPFCTQFQPGKYKPYFYLLQRSPLKIQKLHTLKNHRHSQKIHQLLRPHALDYRLKNDSESWSKFYAFLRVEFQILFPVAEMRQRLEMKERDRERRNSRGTWLKIVNIFKIVNAQWSFSCNLKTFLWRNLIHSWFRLSTLLHRMIVMQVLLMETFFFFFAGLRRWTTNFAERRTRRWTNKLPQSSKSIRLIWRIIGWVFVFIVILIIEWIIKT